MFSLIGILWGFCLRNAAGHSVRARLVDITTLTRPHMGYEAYSGKTKAIGKYPACMDAMNCVVLHLGNTRSATVRALMRSRVEASTIDIVHQKARSFAKPMQQK